MTLSKRSYALVNGLNMYYEIHGEGQPLVLLHGALSAIGTSFSKVLPQLSSTRQVIAVEQQAHGHTADIDRPLTYEQMADDTAALLQQLGIEKADLFGWSMGAGIALQIAIRHPEVVRKLVLASVTYNRNGFYHEVLDWPPEVIQSINAPTLLIIGDSDVVRPEHTVELFRLLGGGVAGDLVGLPRSQLAVLPGTTHVTLVDRADWLVSMITQFLLKTF